jgi:exonuclease III
VRIVTSNVNSLRMRLRRVLDYRKGAKPSDHAPLVADLT